MRKVATLGTLALFTVGALAASPVDPETNTYRYQRVVEVTEASAAELTARARVWVEETYTSPDAVTRLDDSGRVVVAGYFRVRGLMGTQVEVWHRLMVEAKDGRYRAVMDGFETSVLNLSQKRDPVIPGTRKGKTGERVLAQIDSESLALLNTLDAAMHKPTPAGANW